MLPDTGALRLIGGGKDFRGGSTLGLFLKCCLL